MSNACLDSEAEIKEQIESTRAQMNRMADELGYIHPEVMRCSQKLDELLLQYYDIARSFSKFRMGRTC